MINTDIRFLIDRHIEIARITSDSTIRREHIAAASELIYAMKSEAPRMYETNVQTFIGVKCYITDDHKKKKKPKELYGAYKEWCINTGQVPVERLRFYEYLKNAGYKKSLYTGLEEYNIGIWEGEE